VLIRPGSLLDRLHGAAAALEQTTCSYGLNPALQDLANQAGLTVCGTDGTGEVRAVERPDHPFFLATLYQPQLSSTAARPHPVFLGFAAAVASSSLTPWFGA
jgi:CTP synthase (UTP-ammonia lyase)